MTIRLGDLLVQHKALTAEERDEILEIQQTSGRPFGVLAEEMFGVAPTVVEHAWAVQYAEIATRIDPRSVTVDPAALACIGRRQAWQFRLIPVHQTAKETTFVTSMEDLARALRFVGWRVPGPASFALCETAALDAGLKIHYPMDGMESDLLRSLRDDLAA